MFQPKAMFAQWNHYDAAILDPQINGAPSRDSGITSHAFWKAQPQTIAPLLDSGDHINRKYIQSIYCPLKPVNRFV